MVVLFDVMSYANMTVYKDIETCDFMTGPRNRLTIATNIKSFLS